MINILHIDSSANLETSFSRKYSQKVVDTICQKFKNCNILRRDLVLNPIPLVTAEWFSGAYMEDSKKTHSQKIALATSDALVNEIMDAQYIVIGSPMHNFTLSSYLKIYIDQICRFNKTFNAKNEGLVKDKKVYLVMSRGGGNYEIGESFNSINHHEPYLRSVLGFIGMKDIQTIVLNNLTKGLDSVRESSEKADEIIKTLTF